MLNRNGKFPKNWILCERVLTNTHHPFPRLVLSLLSDYSSTSAINLLPYTFQPSTYSPKHSSHQPTPMHLSAIKQSSIPTPMHLPPISTHSIPTLPAPPPARLQLQAFPLYTHYPPSLYKQPLKALKLPSNYLLNLP